MSYGFNSDKSVFDLSNKANASHTHDLSDVNDLLDGSTIDIDLIPTLTAAKIPSLPASKTTSGTFDVARIPQLTDEKLPDHITANDTGSSVLLNSYTSVDSPYTFASDGYVNAYAPIGEYVNLYIIGSSSINRLAYLYASGGEERNLYVRKGMRAYVYAISGTNAYASFVPLA